MMIARPKVTVHVASLDSEAHDTYIIANSHSSEAMDGVLQRRRVQPEVTKEVAKRTIIQHSEVQVHVEGRRG